MSNECILDPAVLDTSSPLTKNIVHIALIFRRIWNSQFLHEGYGVLWISSRVNSQQIQSAKRYQKDHFLFFDSSGCIPVIDVVN